MLKPTAPTPQLTVARPNNRLLIGLTVGQTLKAQVVQGTPPEQGGGRALLLIGRTPLDVRTQTPLRTGSTLTLQVTELGKRIGLRLIEQDRERPPAPRTDPILRRLVPQQAGSGPLFTSLASSVAPSREDAELLNAWQALRRAMPMTENIIQAQGLKQAVRDSGMFLEAKLASGTPPPSLQVDLKAAALRLLAALVKNPASTPAAQGSSGGTGILASTPPPPLVNTGPVPQARAAIPPEMTNPKRQLEVLRHMVEGTLARMNLHQLASTVGSQAEGTQSWFFEVPVRDGDAADILHLRITEEERQRDRDGAPERVWSVELAVDLPGLGPIHARIQVLGEAVRTAFWAERDDTAERIARELPRLRASLEAHALEVAAMSASAGAPETGTGLGDTSSLLDTNA